MRDEEEIMKEFEQLLKKYRVDDITDEKLEEIRKQYPVEYEDIGRFHSFEQILGKKPYHYSENERKERWFKVMKLSSKYEREWWTDTSGCHGCGHLDANQSWCNLQGLPCTVNPITSYQAGMLGMACMGLGYQEAWPDLFKEEDAIF